MGFNAQRWSRLLRSLPNNRAAPERSARALHPSTIGRSPALVGRVEA